MSSPEDRRTFEPRKNPERTCRAIAEALAECHKPISKERSSSKGNPNAATEPHGHPGATPIKHLPDKKTRRKVVKPYLQQTESGQTVIPDLPATNGSLSSVVKDDELLVPQQAAKCVRKLKKRQRKGRWRKGNQPSKKGVGLRSDVSNGEPSERLDSCPKAGDCADSAETKEMPRKKFKVKHSCARSHDQAPVRTSTAFQTHSTLGPSAELDPSASHSYSALGPCTPQRRRAAPRFTSTPVTSACPPLPVSTDSGPCGAKMADQNELNMCPVKSSLSDVLSQKRVRPQVPRTSVARRKKKEQQDLCTALFVKPPRRKAEEDPLQPGSQSAPRVRPRFELQDVALLEPEQALPSDLSIKLCVQEEEPYPLDLSLSLQDDEEEEEDEELPSFLQQISQKPSLIREGLCVWCKLRKYPFWPAVVKSVNHKNKKASIVFIDGLLFDKKTVKKGFSVSLRTLKPFDCEESEQFVDLAKEKYGDIITWCLDLVSDYRIRIGCGSFVGSFIEYFDDDISCPVRKKYPKLLSSELTFPSQELLSEQGKVKGMVDGAAELKEGKSPSKEALHLKKVLPDRTLAARNRANERLVDFIVKRRGVESRLLAVISGQEPSKWLQALQSSSRSVVEVYLEDEEQVDKVYRYLEKLCEMSPELETSDRIRFILDVLLPEALIYAIAGVDHISLEKAEAKYRRGPCHSNRERQEFDLMIEQQMKMKAAWPSP